MKQELGVQPSDYALFDQYYSVIEKDLCRGKEINHFLPSLKKKFSLPLLSNYDWLNYYLDNFHPNPFLKPLLARLKNRYRLGLLTNQYPRMLAGIFAAGLTSRATWELIIDSSQVGMQKPDRKIYLYAQDQAGVPAAEILFIDNSPNNLVVPDNLGWQTFLYDSKNFQKSTRKLTEFLTSI